MPELPEVETVCRTLRPHLLGLRIDRVDVREHRLRRPIEENFARQLVGRTIESVRRRAKYIVMDVGNGDSWVVHLGMSGQLCVGPPPQDAKHVHVLVALSSGKLVYYRDPRRFGLMMLASGEAELGELGVEPLGEDFSADLLWALRRRHRRLSVKSLLMDSRKVVGIGNIYANEVLFESGIRPGRRYGRVTRREIERLVDRVPAILSRAIESGGSSLLDYRDAEGRAGAFQESFWVYDRAGEPCRVCASPIRAKVQCGRSSFYCPQCQV